MKPLKNVRLEHQEENANDTLPIIELHRGHISFCKKITNKEMTSKRLERKLQHDFIHFPIKLSDKYSTGNIFDLVTKLLPKINDLSSTKAIVILILCGVFIGLLGSKAFFGIAMQKVCIF